MTPIPYSSLSDLIKPSGQRQMTGKLAYAYASINQRYISLDSLISPKLAMVIIYCEFCKQKVGHVVPMYCGCLFTSYIHVYCNYVD